MGSGDDAACDRSGGEAGEHLLGALPGGGTDDQGQTLVLPAFGVLDASTFPQQSTGQHDTLPTLTDTYTSKDTDDHDFDPD